MARKIASIHETTKAFTPEVVTANSGTEATDFAAGNDSRINGAAQKASNLSDLASAAIARTNLGLGGAAVLNVGTAAGTVAAGDDGRIVNAVRHRGNKFSVIGTSIEEGGCSIVGQTADFKIGDGWFPLACFLTHQRMMLHRAAGVSGNTSTQMLARFATDITAYAPDWCVFGAPTNDYAADTNWVQAKINMAAMWTAATAAGIGVIVCTMLPRTGTNAIPIDKVIAYNTWVKAQAAANRWHVFDLFAAAVDPATGGFLSGYSSDGVHPVDVGAHAIATAAAAYFTANILPTLAAPREPDLALVNADATNLVASNACLTVDATSDGIPDGWTVSLNGSSTTAVSLVDVAGVPGKMFQMDTTVAGSTRQYVFTLAAPTVGTNIRIQARIEVEGQSADSKVSFLLNFTGLSGYNLRPMLEWSFANGSGVVTIEGTVPVGATGAVLYFNRSAGTGKVRLGQPTVRVVG